MAEKPKYLKGQLLLDSGQLQGSFFQRTVVLICQHDAEGAFGLVLNQPAGKTASEVFLTDIPENLRDLPIFVGGPVQPSALSFLKLGAYLPEGDVLPSLSMGHSLEELLESEPTPFPSTKLKLFAGYAGWSPGQLEGEIKRNAWLIHPATVDTVFDPDSENLWRNILREKGGMYRLLAESPEDLSWN